MREITVEESRKIMIDVLKDVTSFCDSNGLVYYLAYGTLIGAIRHQGFIPWDDDIDIMIPRPDYDKFVSLYHEKGKHGIITPLIDKECFVVYSKVYDERTIKIERGIDYNRYSPIGIDIDVFPLDGMASNPLMQKREARLLRFLSNCLRRTLVEAVIPNSIIGILSYLLFTPICRLLGKDFLLKKIILLSKKNSWESSEYVHVVFPSEKITLEQYKKLDFKSRVSVVFEGDLFWAPENYDSVLKSYYGDYMQLPPIEERATHHTNKVYWKSNL